MNQDKMHLINKVFNNDDLYEDNVIGRSESINKKTSYFEYKIPINKRTLRYYKKALFITNSQSVSIIPVSLCALHPKAFSSQHSHNRERSDFLNLSYHAI